MQDVFFRVFPLVEANIPSVLFSPQTIAKTLLLVFL